MNPDIILVIFYAAVSLLAAVITVADKRSSERKGERIPEKTLLAVAAVGGALSMYITMKIIRHKTKKKKFMAGLPLITVLHAVLVYFMLVCGLI